MYQEKGNDEKYFLGSASVQIGNTIAEALLAESQGSLDDVSFEMTGASAKVEFQNTKPRQRRSVTGCKVAYKYGELDLDKVYKYFGSDADVLTTTAGTATAHTDPLVAGSWNFNKPLAFLFQNASGARPTSIVITAGVDGVLDFEKDYEVVQIGRYWAYVLLDEAAGKLTTENQSISVAYSTASATGKVLELNASNSIPETFAMVLTHETDAGKIFQIQIPAVQSASFFKLPFVKDGGTDVVKADVEFEGIPDADNHIAKIIDDRDIYEL